MIGRADIEGSKSDVAMNAWPPQASYPCGVSQRSFGAIWPWAFTEFQQSPSDQCTTIIQKVTHHRPAP